jgi:asparagine synthetase B (glutamine-hydrolysing)
MHEESVVTTPGLQLRLHFASAVLALRGRHTPQPLIGSRGVLCWNGQVFQGLEVPISENDTELLFGRIESGDDVLSVLAGIEGP